MILILCIDPPTAGGPTTVIGLTSATPKAPEPPPPSNLTDTRPYPDPPPPGLICTLATLNVRFSVHPCLTPALLPGQVVAAGFTGAGNTL